MGNRFRTSERVGLAVDPTEKMGVIGVSGSGKSCAARVIAEGMHLGAMCSVGIIDPVGIWWGLRATPDGTGRALPFWICGGTRADVPIPDPSAAAEWVVSSAVSVVFDVSTMPLEDMHQWCWVYFKKLMELAPHARQQLHTIIEEASLIVPQKSLGTPMGRACKNSVAVYTRVGRNFGYGLTVVAQRAANVEKDVLTQCPNLLLMRLSAGIDRRALQDWVSANSAQVNLEGTLAEAGRLPTGVGFLWAPSWAGTHPGYCKVQVRPPLTYHPGPKTVPHPRTVVLTPATSWPPPQPAPAAQRQSPSGIDIESIFVSAMSRARERIRRMFR